MTATARYGEHPDMLITPRLRLVPTALALARAEIADRAEFARLLGATVPENWPPETLADALPLFLQLLEAAPDAVGWFGWYANTLDAPATLAGSIGFKGPPRDNAVEIGYAVLPQFQNRGLATEMVAALVRWAFGQPSVTRVVAEVQPTNLASRRVLAKIGFVPAGPGQEAGHDRYELLGENRIE